jgi:MFS family permease
MKRRSRTFPFPGLSFNSSSGCLSGALTPQSQFASPAACPFCLFRLCSSCTSLETRSCRWITGSLAVCVRLSVPRITGQLLNTVLIPFRLIHLVGEGRKTHALALVTVFSTVVNLCGPLFGAASDAMPYSRTFGRRRPFIVVGMLCVCSSIYLMKEARSYPAFMVGWLLFCLGNNTAQPAYSCLLPELIPERQRNVASGIFVLFQVSGALVSSGLGLMIGRGHIGDATAYAILLSIEATSLCTGIVSMGRRPGLWVAERPPSATVDTTPTPLVRGDGEAAEAGDGVTAAAAAGGSWLRQVRSHYPLRSISCACVAKAVGLVRSSELYIHTTERGDWWPGPANGGGSACCGLLVTQS